MSENYEALMQEPAGGYNHGRSASTDPDLGEFDSLDVEDQRNEEFMRDGGFGIVHGAAGGGHDTGGLVAHRGVLHPDEYVDESLLQIMVERRLGFTFDQIRSVYRSGPLTADALQLRDKIDARLLVLSRFGNMSALAKSLGLGDATIERALARAKSVEHVES